MNQKYAISANSELRQKMKAYGVTFWQIADVLGVSEMTTSRRFRKELSPIDKEKYSKTARRDICRGLSLAENPFRLLMIAVGCIADMSGDGTFLTSCQQSLVLRERIRSGS